MSTVNDVLTYARQLSSTDSNGISDTLGIAFTNDALQDFIRDLVDRGIDAAQTYEAYADLTTNNPNTYLWPSDMFALKTIEVDFTGSGGQNFLQAQQYDVSNIQNVSFSYLRVNQPSSIPLFDNRGDTFELAPIPPAPVTGGLRIFYYLLPTDFTTTADTITYPITLDYRCLAAKVSYFYALSLEKGGRTTGGQAADFEAEYQRRLNKIITILAPGSKQPIQPTPLQDSGWEY